jgi:hypothetical protein
MGQQIIKQPDGKFAVFSSVVDAFVLYDCTADDIVEHFAEAAAEQARQTARRLVEQVSAGEKAYYQFTMPWDEALALHLGNCDDEQTNADLKAIR